MYGFFVTRARELLEDIGVLDKPFITANQRYEKKKIRISY
jgi:hypothetical protein